MSVFPKRVTHVSDIFITVLLSDQYKKDGHLHVVRWSVNHSVTDKDKQLLDHFVF